MEPKLIRVVGARQHNLRNVSVDLPRDRLVVLTGLSGSGKSSLAFDTIYAEGQRKYVESLSVHARFFLEQIGKPDVDRIEGLPPTLAIEQHATAANPRSTVATTTEIYDFLRLLFARVGVPHCPKCGRQIRRHTIDQVVDAALAYPPESRVMILAPLARGRGGDRQAVLKRVQREGFVRVRVNGELRDVKELAELPAGRKVDIDVVVDRLVLRPDLRSRLADAVELSFSLAEGMVILSRANGTVSGNQPAWTDEVFTERPVCTICGVGLTELSPRVFSFNSPYGACEACDGLGKTWRFDPELIVPDPEKPLSNGAIAPWLAGGKKTSALHAKLIRALCAAFKVKPETPFKQLPEDLQRILLYGTQGDDEQHYGLTFEGVIPSLERRAKPAGDENRTGRLNAYQSEQVCEKCGGARLRPAPLAVRIGTHNIHDVTLLTIERAAGVFADMRFEGEAAAIAAPILHEVRQRLRFLNEVGLGYLTLDRASATLSGGEAQRIRLATQLGSGLVGVCYVLDEPTIGLHQRDNERLLNSIRRLVDIGNTVLVVEHDEDVIRAADHLVDMGPGAGLHGGKIIAAGAAREVLEHPQSLTGKFLRGEYAIPLPEQRRTPRKADWLEVRGARQNNLKNIDVKIPLGVFCAVTGVSGSGKSTLVSQILLPALRRRLYNTREPAGLHDKIGGATKIDKVIEIDQTPIGRSPRSNPATYAGAFDEIRRLYAKTKEAHIRGYSASRFSFNAKGGRCEACQGQGTRRIEMHFLPDVFVECQECKGTRYNRETLEVRYRGKSIADVLEMRVEEALRFFDNIPRIHQSIQVLADVGLGYIRLGQPSNTLSGGEAQRVKLAAELSRPGGVGPLVSTADAPDFAELDADSDTNGNTDASADVDEKDAHARHVNDTENPAAARHPIPAALAAQRFRQGSHTLYVLDEPTSGLHFADIQTLLAVLNRLVDMGNTVLVIEHNLDVIKTADWIVDLGPEGGDAGGFIVCEGPPEAIVNCATSHTGRYLRAKL